MSMERRSKKDTREFRRRTVRILVDYQTEDGVQCDYATTLGPGGMFLETERQLAPGTPLKLRFKLSSDDEIHEIEGAVIWQRVDASRDPAERASGLGIRFTDPAAISRLARALEVYDF